MQLLTIFKYFFLLFLSISHYLSLKDTLGETASLESHVLFLLHDTLIYLHVIYICYHNFL